VLILAVDHLSSPSVWGGWRLPRSGAPQHHAERRQNQMFFPPRPSSSQLCTDFKFHRLYLENTQVNLRTSARLRKLLSGIALIFFSFLQH
jgi:hypothetical protein